MEREVDQWWKEGEDERNAFMYSSECLYSSASAYT